MSMYKAPMYVINKLEAIRSHFFNGGDPNIRKMTFVKWENVLASKDKGGMGVSSFFLLNGAIIFKGISAISFSRLPHLWSRVIKAIHRVDGWYWGENYVPIMPRDYPPRQILDSKGAIPTKTAADAKIAIQEMAEYSQNGITEHLQKPEVLKLLTDWLLYKPSSTTLGERLKRAPYQPGRQYRAAGPGFYQRNNGNSSYPDRRQTLEESLTKFMAESSKSHEENLNIIKEIRASTDAAIRNQGASIKTFEIQIGQMSKVLQERGIGGLPDSTKPNPRDHVKLISTAKADSYEISRMGCSPYAVSISQHGCIFSETVPFPRRLQTNCCELLEERHKM
ncbi:hypothetical protein Tco_0129130 [Tanacetum coccineum]